MLGEIYRKNGEWKFWAIGQGFYGGFDTLIKNFGGKSSLLNVPAQHKNSSIVESAIQAFSDTMAEKIVDEMAVVHIIGAFSAGKSRLVRELLRKHTNAKQLLPISSLERQTALPLEITYGERPTLLLMANHASEQQTVLTEFPSRDEQMRFDADTYHLRLEIPEPALLLGNVELCSADEGIKRLFLKDMPGWNSGDSFLAENPLANGLVGADNISLVYVVRASGVDSQDDLSRLQAIFAAVDAGDAFFFNGFNLVVVVTRSDEPDEHEGIKQRLTERLQHLAEAVGIEDRFTMTILNVDFGKEQDLLKQDSFIEALWQAVFAPIATEKQTASVTDWATRIQHWSKDWLIQTKLADSLALIRQAKQFVDHFKKEGDYIAKMNNTRLLGLSESERRQKVHSAWLKQVGQWQPSSDRIEMLQLPDDHPLALWWQCYWLAKLSLMMDQVDGLVLQMDKAIMDLPLSATDLPAYFQKQIDDTYSQTITSFQHQFLCFCDVVEPLVQESNNAKVVATLLSLSLLDAKYTDYYQLLKAA